jgi:hypothetical protein
MGNRNDVNNVRNNSQQVCHTNRWLFGVLGRRLFAVATAWQQNFYDKCGQLWMNGVGRGME